MTRILAQGAKEQFVKQLPSQLFQMSWALEVLLYPARQGSRTAQKIHMVCEIQQYVIRAGIKRLQAWPGQTAPDKLELLSFTFSLVSSKMASVNKSK